MIENISSSKFSEFENHELRCVKKTHYTKTMYRIGSSTVASSASYT